MVYTIIARAAVGAVAKKAVKTVAKKAVKTAKPSHPSFISSTEAEDFNRMRHTYNSRVYRFESKYASKFGVNREDIRKTGWSPVPLSRTASQLKSRAQYEALSDYLTEQLSKKPAEVLNSHMKGTFFDVIDAAYIPAPEDREWLQEQIDEMTPEEIVQFRMENPGITADFFEQYQENKTGEIDADSFDRQWADFKQALISFRGARS